MAACQYCSTRMMKYIAREHCMRTLYIYILDLVNTFFEAAHKIFTDTTLEIKKYRY